MGLPIHRMGGTSKSRVYAYKNELDEWLKNQLNIKKDNVAATHLNSFFKPGIIVLSVLAILIGIYFIFFRSPDTSSTQGLPPPQENPKGVPASTGPLIMGSGDIVTTEWHWGGRLRVWRKNKSKEYEEIWRIEPVRHSSLAIGDLDGIEGSEIVAPGVCREKENVGERLVTRWRFFLNIYKPGEKDWWKTTFFSKPDCLYVDTFLSPTEIRIGDLDPEPGNEIVLINKEGLGIIKYMPEEDEFRLLGSRYAFLKDKELVLKSMEVINIDEDPNEEIIIAADEWEDERRPPNKGWILIFKVREGWPEIVKSIAVDAQLGFQSLRVGDVIPGKGLEILSPAYRNDSDLWTSYIMGWNIEGEKLISRLIYEKGDPERELAHLDIGDMSPEPGEEIVIALHSPNELLCLKWNGQNLVECCPRYPLDYRVSPFNIFVKEAPPGRDSPGQVVVLGGSVMGDGQGDFYLEILDYRNGFFSKWKRMGGAKGEWQATYAAFGR
ncbi:hypothetical protein ACFLR7_04570 [Acidobacteriota bacterium]